MEYLIRLNEILDKCDLSKEEREAFENFMDAKCLKYKEICPNYEDDLRQAIDKNPILGKAKDKIYKSKQWGNIISLWHSIY